MENCSCPICSNNCKWSGSCDESGRIYNQYYCLIIQNDIQILDFLLDKKDEKIAKKYNLIFSNLLKNKDSQDYRPRFTYHRDDIDDYSGMQVVDVSKLEYPSSHVEKIDRSLMNIYYLLGDKQIRFSSDIMRMRCTFSQTDLDGRLMMRSLQDFGYITEENYRITEKGWYHIDELLRNEITENIGFIAISFDKETEGIRACLKESITDCGFEPILINEVEHNNQIVPEIVKYIEKCRFLVMDCSLPNCGAYYEAGIARGCNKEVIICCRKADFENPDKSKRPHFDISQQSMIVWESFDDLKDKLKKRIKMTVVG